MKSRIMTHRVFLLNPKRLLIVLLVFSLAFFFVQQNAIKETRAAGNLLFVGDFETGDFSGWHCKNGSWGNCPTVVSAQGSVQPRAGSFMMKSFLNPRTSSVAYRTETVLLGENDILHEFNIGSEYWFGLSIYLPGGQPLEMGVLGQFHGRADTHLGERSRNPHLALRLYDGSWRVTMNWDSKPNTYESGERVYDGSKDWVLGAAEADKWTDWVIHVKLSYESDGLLEVYQDGQKVISHNGGNCYNDERGPYWKMGIYNASWKDRPGIGARVAYHDELRVGGADASYKDVASRGSTPPQIFLPFVSKSSLP